MSGYYNRNNRGITKKLGPVTAYADAVLAGYKGTREQWAQDMAKLGQNVTQVAQNTELTTELAEQTRENTEQVAKDTADVRRLADETSDNAVQVASNTAESNRLAKETKQAAAQAKADAEYAGAAADNFRVDTTLSEAGKAAEAKTTGEKFAQLSEEIDDIAETAVPCNSKETAEVKTEDQVSFVNAGKILDNHGELYDNANHSTSDFIDLNGVDGIYRTGTTQKFNLSPYAFYDENKELVEYRTDGTDYELVEYEGKQVAWLTMNQSARYVRISWETTRPYTYWIVRTKEVVTCYDAPYMTFNGEDLLGMGASAKNITNEIVYETNGANFFNPEYLDSAGFYLNFSDGKTKVSSTRYVGTSAFVELPEAQNALYVMQNISDTSTNQILVYCYDGDGNYLGYRNLQIFDTYAGKRFDLIDGTVKIKVFLAEASATGSNICLSLTELTEFVPYEILHKIKEDALPKDTTKEYIPLYGKTIVNFGDSIFGNKRPPNDVSTALANITGATVYNCGFGGCRMSAHSLANFDPFSMYRLAYAIANNDFSLQDAVDIPNASGVPAYFEGTRNLLKNIDWNKVDIITIAYGTNDWTAEIPLDNENNPLDINTFCGALRYSLETIITAYPHIKVFVCGQTYRFWVSDDGNFVEDSDTKVIEGNKLTDVVTATETVSKSYHVPFIDNYYDLGINKYNRRYYFTEPDGTHHNVLGAKLMAEHIAKELF